MHSELIKIYETINVRREISRLEFDQKSVEIRRKAGLKSLMLRLSFVTNVFLLRLGIFRDTNNYREPPRRNAFRALLKSVDYKKLTQRAQRKRRDRREIDSF